ncbi:MAG: phosphotransferase family protein [Nevskia sp.]|nr:phosphotransferase family protein [Nevskia sp.]
MSLETSPAVLDRPGTVRQESAFDAARILPFLRARIAGLPSGPVELTQFEGGSSNLTYQLRVGDTELILRRPPAGTKAATAHDMGREFRVLEKLSPHFPCPRPLAYCEDESLIGSTFYVMEKIKGIIVRRDLPPGLHYTPEEARRLAFNLLDTLVKLHTLDYRAIGLGDLGKPAGYVGRQVKGWCERMEKARTEETPPCEALAAWFRSRQPADSARPGIIHNDYRLDNAVLSPADRLTIIGVLDWEMATIGDPLMDFGGVLAYWIQPDDAPAADARRVQPCNLPGMPRREEMARYYGEKSGLDTSRMDFYYAFNLFRLAVIMQQLYYRYKFGQTSVPRFALFPGFIRELIASAEAVAEQSKL